MLEYTGVGLRRRSAPTGPHQEDWSPSCDSVSPGANAAVPELRPRGYAGGYASIWSANAPKVGPSDGMTWSPAIAAEWNRQQQMAVPSAPASVQGDRKGSW